MPRQYHQWTNAEEEILRRLYPSGGAAACAPSLPDLSRKAIAARAGALGLRLDPKAHSRLMRQGVREATGCAVNTDVDHRALAAAFGRIDRRARSRA